MKSKNATLWAVVSPRDNADVFTMRYRRTDSIKAAEARLGHSWANLTQRKFRVARFNLTPAP